MTSSRSAATLAEVLRAYDGDDGAAGITYVAPRGTDARQSYAELLEESRRGLAVLQDAGLRPGDFAILLLSSSREVLPAFWACVLGGIVPTVLTVPRTVSRDTEALRKLRHVWTLLDRPVVVCGEDQDAALASAAAGGEAPLPGLRSLTYARLAAGDRTSVGEHRPAPGDLAILQFSSGSTGTAKGVRLTHANLVANLRDMIPRWHACPDDTFVSWMPESHDMGLICMHLHALFAGADQVKLSPLSFVRDPSLLLTTVDRHRGTITAAPNFGLALLLDKALADPRLDVDLSSLRIIGNAAEPISVRIMRRFLDACEPLGLRREAMTCCYGLAEATVVVSALTAQEPAEAVRLDREAFHQAKIVPATEGDETAVEIACLGRPVDSTRVRIADDGDEALPDDCIGHVQVAGPSVTSGYYGEARATAELFAGEWLRTGDLGFVRDGRLYVTGRVKDVIFTQGNNVYAADVEARAIELSALGPGEVVACGYTDWDSGHERLAIFVKARRLPDDELLGLRQRLLEALGLRVDAILPVRSIPRTTSGKLQRHKLAEQLHRGELRAEVEHWEELCRQHEARRRPASVAEALAAAGRPPRTEGARTSSRERRPERPCRPRT